jgi:hypothetical protein
MRLFLIFTLYISNLSLLFASSNYYDNLLQYRTPPSIDDRLKIIPPDELHNIEIFFKILLKDEICTYTLFGEKPCSVVDWIEIDRVSNFNSKYRIFLDFESLLLNKGLNSWLKYSYLFPSTNFILVKDNSIPNHRSMYLINKKNLLAVLKKNKLKIEQHLNITIDDITQDTLFRNNGLLSILINSDSYIHGIMFGFGESNAALFVKRGELSKNINKLSYPPELNNLDNLKPLSKLFVSIESKKPKEKIHSVFLDSSKLTTLVDELNALIDSKVGFEIYGSDIFLDEFQYPAFATTEENEETKELEKIYSADRQKIINAYRDKPFLEVTLQQWMNPQ